CKDNAVVGATGHVPDIHVDRRHRAIADHQSASAIDVADPYDVLPAPRRHSVEELDPDVVAILDNNGRRPGGHVDSQHLHAALIATLHLQKRWVVCCPADPREVGKSVAIPTDVLPVTIEFDKVQRDVRIVCT